MTTYPVAEIEYGTYPWLQREVGGYLGYGFGAGAWNPEQVGKVDSIVQSGYMQMLYPAPLPSGDEKQARQARPHQWSFLSPVAVLSLEANQNTYALPDDFTGMAGGFATQSLGAASSTETVPDQQHQIAVVSDVQLRQLIAATPQTATPQYASVVPVVSEGSGKQAWSVMFYPTPNAATVLEYRYLVYPDTLSSEKPYPLGGRQFAELLLQSCLAVAEQRETKAEGVATARYLERLAAAIQLDGSSQEDLEIWPVGEDPGDLTIDRAYLERIVGTALGYGPQRNAWTHKQDNIVSEVIRRGLRKFYVPPVLPGDKYAHAWSFLRPKGSIQTVSDVWEYDLPDDFAMFDGPLTFDPGESVLYPPVRLVSEHQLRSLRLDSRANYRPSKAALLVSPVTDDGQTRWRVVFWPTPDDSYTINYRYQRNPSMLGSDVSKPAGGMPHAQTVVEACLLVADDILGVKNSPYYPKFIESLKASVSHDRLANAPDTLGRNRDDSDGVEAVDYRERQVHVVTYNGVSY